MCPHQENRPWKVPVSMNITYDFESSTYMLMGELGHSVSSVPIMMELALVECETIFTLGTREKLIFKFGGHTYSYAIAEKCKFADGLWQHARDNYS